MNCACKKHGEYGILPLLSLTAFNPFVLDPAGIFSSDESTETKITEEIQKEQIEDAYKRQAASGGASPDQQRQTSSVAPYLIGGAVVLGLLLAAGGGYAVSRR